MQNNMDNLTEDDDLMDTLEYRAIQDKIQAFTVDCYNKKQSRTQQHNITPPQYTSKWEPIVRDLSSHLETGRFIFDEECKHELVQSDPTQLRNADEAENHCHTCVNCKRSVLIK